MKTLGIEHTVCHDLTQIITRGNGRSGMTTLLNDWEHKFQGCQPVAHLFKTALPERWVRFHSLPGSKRYADDSEYSIILTRHNSILEQLVCSQRHVVLLTTGYSDSPTPVREGSELEKLDPMATHWRSIPVHELDSRFAFPTYWHIFASDWQWCPGLFDSIVRLVADDVLHNVMIVDPTCHWLLHPYDGGMDVIAKSSEDRDRIKLSYADWLSSAPDGW